MYKAIEGPHIRDVVPHGDLLVLERGKDLEVRREHDVARRECPAAGAAARGSGPLATAIAIIVSIVIVGVVIVAVGAFVGRRGPEVAAGARARTGRWHSAQRRRVDDLAVPEPRREPAHGVTNGREALARAPEVEAVCGWPLFFSISFFFFFFFFLLWSNPCSIRGKKKTKQKESSRTDASSICSARVVPVATDNRRKRFLGVNMAMWLGRETR
jgi:hypothetical protein